MPEKVSKMIVLPPDGSEFDIKSIDYVNLMSGPKHAINPVLMYVLPSLPPAMIEERLKNRETAGQLKKMKQRNETLADEILGSAKKVLLQYDFSKDRIKIVCQGRKRDIAKDILAEADKYGCGTIILGRQGDSGNKEFTMGSIARKVIDGASDKAIWVV